MAVVLIDFLLISYEIQYLIYIYYTLVRVQYKFSRPYFQPALNEPIKRSNNGQLANMSYLLQIKISS